MKTEVRFTKDLMILMGKERDGEESPGGDVHSRSTPGAKGDSKSPCRHSR